MSETSEFIRVCALDELPAEGGAKAVIDGRDVAIVRTDEGVFAIDDTCTHANVSLSEGEVEGCLIECWLHGSQFDLRTGEPRQLPATVPVAVHQVKVENGEVFVALAQNAPVV
ncbi:non-heme iron oxygenase ferredoxin subunit [Kribbia dieselivorans]|uniref:non-heme iron oxygenase ferredoxin subunit n=1 Tax=Kribbia dieselivorans TaxID=331526 RepID=UPI0008396FEE|nr:non-heme iron oxygenase ferredoxin subunit [Kribbia dieselivorans]